MSTTPAPLNRITFMTRILEFACGDDVRFVFTLRRVNRTFRESIEEFPCGTMFSNLVASFTALLNNTYSYHTMRESTKLLLPSAAAKDQRSPAMWLIVQLVKHGNLSVEFLLEQAARRNSLSVLDSVIELFIDKEDASSVQRLFGALKIAVMMKQPVFVERVLAVPGFDSETALKWCWGAESIWDVLHAQRNPFDQRVGRPTDGYSRYDIALFSIFARHSDYARSLVNTTSQPLILCTVLKDARRQSVGECALGVVRALVEIAGADCTIPCSSIENANALVYCCLEYSNVELLNILLTSGRITSMAQLSDPIGDHGYNVLTAACAAGNNDTFRSAMVFRVLRMIEELALLQQQQQPQSKLFDINRNTCNQQVIVIHQLCRWRCTEAIAALAEILRLSKCTSPRVFKEPVDLNARDSLGLTPLMLVSRGADQNIKETMTKLLKEHGATET